MSISREDFLVWEKSSATIAFKKAIVQYVEGLKEELSGMAGKEVWQSGFYVGAIQASRDIFAFHMEELERADD